MQPKFEHFYIGPLNLNPLSKMFLLSIKVQKGGLLSSKLAGVTIWAVKLLQQPRPIQDF